MANSRKYIGEGSQPERAKIAGVSANSDDGLASQLIELVIYVDPVTMLKTTPPTYRLPTEPAAGSFAKAVPAGPTADGVSINTVDGKVVAKQRQTES